MFERSRGVSGKVLLLPVEKYLKSEQRKKFIGEVLFACSYQEFKDLNVRDKAVLYNILSKLLATIEISDSNWVADAIREKNIELFSRLLQKGKFDSGSAPRICGGLEYYMKDDILIIQSMLEVLITTAALNPENLIVNNIIEHLQKYGDAFPKLILVFNKLMGEKEQLKERALRAQEQEKASFSQSEEAPSSKSGESETSLSVPGSVTVPVSDSSKAATQALCNHLLDLSEKVKKKENFDKLISEIMKVMEGVPSFDDASIQAVSAILNGLPSNIARIQGVIQKIEAAMSQQKLKQASLNGHSQTRSSSISSSSGSLREVSGDIKRQMEDQETSSGFASSLISCQTRLGLPDKEKEKRVEDAQTPLLFSFDQTVAQQFTNSSVSSSSTLSSSSLFSLSSSIPSSSSGLLSSSLSGSSSSLSSMLSSSASKITWPFSTVAAPIILSAPLGGQELESNESVPSIGKSRIIALFEAIEAGETEKVEEYIKALKLLDQNIENPVFRGTTLAETLFKSMVTEDMREAVEQAIAENLRQKGVQPEDGLVGGLTWENEDDAEQTDDLMDGQENLWSDEEDEQQEQGDGQRKRVKKNFKK